MRDYAGRSRREFLAKVPLFEKLDAGELGSLIDVARIRHLDAREELFHKGDAGCQVFVVVSGRLKVTATSADGEDVVFAIMNPQEVVGELALLGGGERTATVTAIEPCELLALDRRDFFPFLRKHPDAAIKLLEVLTNRLRRVSQLVEDTQFLNLPSRLAKRLLNLSQAYGRKTADGIRIDLRLSQQELGEMIGTTRESINKQMRSWVSQGVVGTDRGYITIHRPGDLETLAGFTVHGAS